MRKSIVLLLIFSFLTVLPAESSETSYLGASVEKISHGIVNTLTGWLEIPYQTVKGFKNGFGEEGKNKLFAGLLGVIRGIVHGIGRTIQGLAQLATGILPNHTDNVGVGIPLDNEYVWQEGKQYSVLKDGVMPIGKKATRGIIDTVGGILEFPGQLNKVSGQNSGKVVFKGFIKAIIYPVARVLSGVYDLVTAFLPNETQQYGQPFDEAMPQDALKSHPFQDNPPEAFGGIITSTELPEVVDFFWLHAFSP